MSFFSVQLRKAIVAKPSLLGTGARFPVIQESRCFHLLRREASPVHAVKTSIFDVAPPARAMPPTPELDDPEFPYRYGYPRRFFPASNAATGQGGVAFQDPVTLAFYMSWFASDYASASTVALTIAAGHIVQCADSNENGEIAYLTIYKDSNADKVSPAVVHARRASATGASLTGVSLDGSSAGLNVYGPYSRGGSMAWDVPADVQHS
jgi:hypothetical protein